MTDSKTDNRLIAAILTVAVNSKKPRAASLAAGKTPIQEIFKEYQELLQYLKADDSGPHQLSR